MKLAVEFHLIFIPALLKPVKDMWYFSQSGASVGIIEDHIAYRNFHIAPEVANLLRGYALSQEHHINHAGEFTAHIIGEIVA